MRDMQVGSVVFSPINGGPVHGRSVPERVLIGEGAGAEAYVPLPDGRRIPVAMSPPACPLPPAIRDALIQARAALATAAGDKHEDLLKPERASVIEQKVALLTAAIAAFDQAAR